MVDKKTFLKELFRKSIHLCSGLMPLFLRINYWLVIIGLLTVLVLYIISEILRMKQIEVPVIAFITKMAARERDGDGIVLGPVMLVLGIVITALVHPLEAATVGIFSLAFGDGFASLVGKCFGHLEIPHTKGKTVEGSLACFFAVLISVFCYTKDIFLSLILAFSAMIIEVIPLRDIDNVIIPVLQSGIYLFLYQLI